MVEGVSEHQDFQGRRPLGRSDGLVERRAERKPAQRGRPRRQLYLAVESFAEGDALQGGGPGDLLDVVVKTAAEVEIGERAGQRAVEGMVEHPSELEGAEVFGPDDS